MFAYGNAYSYANGSDSFTGFFRVQIREMTCRFCEIKVAAALESAGAGDVQVSHSHGEATFQASAGSPPERFQAAIQNVAYDSAVELRPLTGQPKAGWLAGAALVALPLLCCGLPLLIGALLTTGAGSWLAAHGSWLGIPVLTGAAAALYLAQRRRTV